MRKPPPTPRRGSTAVRFRKEIEQAQAEGVNLDETTLRLTLTDASDLKRDANLAVSDISFTEGVMRFLGVKVEAGGVTKSAFDRA